MAGIDKTYVSTWEEYSEIVNWCKSLGEVTDDYGVKFRPIEWVNEYTEEEFKEYIDNQYNYIVNRYKDNPNQIQDALVGTDYNTIEEYARANSQLVLWNTPSWFDVWLIRYCPIKTIRNRLSEQYSKKSIERIEKFDTDVDHYKRTSGSGRFRILHCSSRNKLRSNSGYCKISVNDGHTNWEYSKMDNTFYSRFDWHHRDRIDDYCCNFFEMKELSMRKVRRFLKNWKLPAGITVEFLLGGNKLTMETI